ncbi:DUF1638 domain-containing protein [Phycicoccus sp. CSK15P-2]|uniref:DUF1638 domain-containing protein n=1 Tax=Phycicoccus sp. CSK15P-2 TaxID=2807627 RepID=UPI00194FE63A|nr:DUF1638 domain-containing protein [Phycicoccus sp. CSK15P-2]MBM6405189.1 DUF1638 domain-containing protein [Phycicoccus sp. CSK15P-2]
MSSSPTVPTSTTGSSTSSRSRAERTALVACGALAQPALDAVAAHGWPLDVHPLPPLLHNRPERIAGEVERLVVALREEYGRVVVGYADCGTYGALDAVCERLEVQRLPGLHCYDLFAGPAEVESLADDEPGTYLLTDFLVRSFSRTVLRELGLDRHPELRDDYFRHYTRVVWLVQTDDPAEQAELRGLAQEAADRVGLPLQVRATGAGGLERALRHLVAPRTAPEG